MVCFLADGYTGTRQYQLAIIARTNAELFDRMVEVTRIYPNARLGFAGKIQSYGFNMLLDMNRLMTRKEMDRITHPFVRRFRLFKHMETVAKQIEDASLLGKITVGVSNFHAFIKVSSMVTHFFIDLSQVRGLVAWAYFSHQEQGRLLPCLCRLFIFVGKFHVRTVM